MNEADDSWFRRHKTISLALFILALLILSGLIMAIFSKKSSPSTPTPTQKSTKTGKQTTPATTSTRTPSGKTVTLATGTYTVGSVILPGLYEAVPAPGKNGTLSITGQNNYIEMLGVTAEYQGETSARVRLGAGDTVEIDDVPSVTFTPVTTPLVTDHKAVTLGSGTFFVGEDIGVGRYRVTSGPVQNGSFVVLGKTTYYNAVFGTIQGLNTVSELDVNLLKNDKIMISGMNQVYFTPLN